MSSILIIASNAVEREGIALVLRQAGFIVSPAPSVDVALAYPAAIPEPDLIILDMMMPERDGRYFMEERKTNPQLANVAVLIVTDLGVAGQEWAESLGACGVVKKPVDEVDLQREVARCLALPRHGR